MASSLTWLPQCGDIGPASPLRIERSLEEKAGPNPLDVSPQVGGF